MAVYKPNPNAPGVAVLVTAVDPKTQMATVVRLNEQGEPMTDEDGQPMLFPAHLSEFATPVDQTAPSPVAPAATQGGPPPSAVPPAATSTEPTSDVAGQLKDMWNAKTKRRGVYLSPATVAKMRQEGTYEKATGQGQVEENFDGQGGTLIVKSKKDLDEARAARDGGQTDMQAIVGTLTGAGVAKPNVAKPAVVQRKDENGAVVQQTAVPQEAVQQTVQEVAQQPGTVEVVTPEQALAEREAKVQEEQQAQRLPVMPAVVNEPLTLATPDRTLSEASKALDFVERQLETPAPGKLTKPDVRGIAGTIGAAGAALRAAAAAAQKRGAPDALIAAANEAAEKVSFFEDKSDKDYRKSRGVSESILRERAQGIRDALKALVDWHNSPEAKAAPVEAKPETKAEKVKKVSKKRSAPKQEVTITPSTVRDITPELVAKEVAEDSALIEDQRRREADERTKRTEPLLQRLNALRIPDRIEFTSRVKKVEELMAKAEAAKAADDVNAYNKAMMDLEFVANETIEMVMAEPPPANVSPIGIKVAPAGETKIGRKKKYVPPKKQAEAAKAEKVEKQAAQIEKVVDQQAPAPAIEVIGLAPSVLQPQQVPGLVAELLGMTQQELSNELNADASGQLTNTLAAILDTMKNRDNWLGWFTAAMRGDVLKDKKNTLRGLIRQYVAAEDSEIPEIWEQMLGIMTDIEGKMLPQRAIAGIREAANVARAYTEIREAIEADLIKADAELTAEELGVGQNEPTDQAQLDMRELGYDEERQATPSMQVVDQGEGGTLASATERATTAPTETASVLRDRLRRLTGFAIREGRFQQMLDDSANGKRTISVRGVANMLLTVAEESGDRSSIVMAQLFVRIANSAPDLPIEVIHPDLPMMDARGKIEQFPSAGRFLYEGLVQLAPARGQDGKAVHLDYQVLQVLMHEAVHAATAYELTANPNGPLAQRLTEIRRVLLKKAGQKYGHRKLMEAMKWYKDGRHNGTPAPALVKEHGSKIYALLNNLELTAETMTSPEFHEFVRNLDSVDGLSWYRKNFVMPLMRAFDKLFGITEKTPQADLLRELMQLTTRTMNAQTLRRRRARDNIRYAEMAADRLGLNPTETAALARKMSGTFFKEELTDAEKRITLALVRDADADFGTGSEHPLYDRLANSAYLTSAEERMRLIDTWRMNRRTPLNTLERNPASGTPRFPNHQQVAEASTPGLAQMTARMNRLMRSKQVGKARDAAHGFVTTDFLVRRAARFFGSVVDAANPLVAWKKVRDMRRSYANQLLELAERTVNSKWMQLTQTESEQLGTVIQNASLWQIDPSLDTTQQKHSRTMSAKAWEQKVLELNRQWSELSPLQQDIYHSTQKYFQQEYSRIRRAAVDMAVDMYNTQLSQLQRTLLYGVRNADTVDKLVGAGKQIDMGEANDRFAAVLKDVLRVSTIKGPYFPLFRSGDFVVEADREGILGDENGPTVFSSKEEANDAAMEIRLGSPKNTAKVVEDQGGYIVKYKVREVSFHESENEAAEALADLKARGLAPKNGVYTRKLSAIGASSMTESMKQLQEHATKLAGDSPEGKIVAQTIETAFLQLLAQKAASASQQLKRQGVAGFKGKEAHKTFATRVRASSWHYANLKTSLAQSRAVARLTLANSAVDLPTPSNMTQQQAVMARGRIVQEVRRRLEVEAAELDAIDHSANWAGTLAGQVGFVNFLATPSYAFVNSMQNVNVALPVMTGKYGMRGAKAMGHGMKAVAGPAFAKAMRGLFSRPGNVTSYDVYTAIAEGLKDHPRFGKFVTGENSALQQLVDLGVINASFVQELGAIANNQNLYVARGLEYLRLFPQGAELWNRISTSLAVLEVTNGNVDAAADMVNQVHFDYSLENRPRYFRQLGGLRMPQWLTMFKMYGVAMYQLTGSLFVDAVSRRGQSREDRARAATALAGIIASHTLSAGVLGGIMVEPLRLLINVFMWAFGDDDEFSDIDTMVQRWATEVGGSEDAGRLISKGMWNALGFDLSGRMGLDRILVYSPPESFSDNELYKFAVGLLGPLPVTAIEKGVRAYELATTRGKPLEAIYELIPVRMLQDARKAWKLLNEGITTKAGATIVGPEQFDWLDVVGTAAGFRTTEAQKVSDLAATEFRYKGWKKARASALIQAYTRAYRAKDEAAKKRAIEDIREFNRKNPKDPITGRSVSQSFRSQEKAAKDRRGEGRNRALQELMEY